MIYDLPTSVEVHGKNYDIRSDYRAILDICIALSDPDLDEQEKAEVALVIFYPGIDDMHPDSYQEAIERCCWFINGGQREEPGKKPKLMDWEQDFPIIISPVNRVLGREIREMEYLHWWTFLSAYMEIGGDCVFSQVISIRSKRARGKKLEKREEEYYRNNRQLIDMKKRYTDEELEEQARLKRLLGE